MFSMIPNPTSFPFLNKHHIFMEGHNSCESHTPSPKVNSLKICILSQGLHHIAK